MALNMNAVGTNSRRKDYGIAEEGLTSARLCRVIDLGLQKRPPYQGQEKAPAYMIRLTFELPDQLINVDGEDKPRWIDKEINLSQHEKSTSLKWFNILDPQNESRGDWGKLVGTPCMLNITHRTDKKDRTHANIGDLLPVMKGMEVGALQNPTVVFDTSNPNVEVFQRLPDFLQEKIKSNLEFQNSKLDRLLSDLPVAASASTGDVHDEKAEEDVSPQAQKPAPTINVDVADFDDDIPF